MDRKRHLKVLLATPERVIFEGTAEAVTIPGSEGELGVLPGHAALVGLLGGGEVKILAGGKVERFFAVGGLLWIEEDRVAILPQTACGPGEIDPEAVMQEFLAARRLHAATEEQYMRAQRVVDLARAKLRYASRIGKGPAWTAPLEEPKEP